jgi:formamidopyrimidine-DNA glycosylase
MPELPEVETIRRFLAKDLLGKVIKKITVLEKKQFIGKPDTVIGKKIQDLYRNGKILSLKLDNNLFLNIHLKLTGQLLYSHNYQQPRFFHKIPFAIGDKMPNRTTRIIVYFADQSALYFNDLRKFGWIKVSSLPEKPKGIDVISKNFTLKQFQQIIASTKKPIKSLLMDQEKIAGLGNIYANDALFEAKIHPMIKSNSLNKDQINHLYKAVCDVIDKGLKYNGSSDEAYILPDASEGRYQNHFQVYGREGLPCLNCQTPIKRVKHGGRSYFYCPKCQKI